MVNIRESMDEPKPATLNGRWKKLWPEEFNDFLDSSASRMK
jgi:hypothetical protein